MELWERKKDSLSIVIPDEHNAVKIMTIHKSKGLEFPVVIFPYDLSIYQQVKPKIWYKNLEKNEFLGFNSALIDYGKKISYLSSYGQEIYNSKQSEFQLDNLNLLYVALTRPIEQLYVISENRNKFNAVDNAKYYSDILFGFTQNLSEGWTAKNDCYFLGKQIRNATKKNEETSNESQILESFISSSWKNHNISISLNSSLLWGTEQKKSIEFGNLIHQMFSKIHTIDDLDDVISEFLLQGVISEDQSVDIKNKMKEVISHPDLRQYFSPESVVMNEQEIISKDKFIKIPDRIILNQNKATVIDYKTGSFSNSHKQQLNNYGNLLSELGYLIENKIIVYLNNEIEVLKFP